jgi:3-hydroxyisobutyrate dehydrogenase
MKIGIAGTGKMGTAMGERLLAEGEELVVWNRTAGRTKRLADAGAAIAESPARLAATADIILTMLTDAPAIDATYRGNDGLLSGNVAGKIFIEMSTVRPETAKQLAADIRAMGAAMVEAPVGGSTGPAREGKLLALVGGDEADVARARPVLAKLCRRVEHVGQVGAGASFKLAINLPLDIYWQALGEAFSLCRQHGVDPARMAELFSDTSGGPAVMKIRHGLLAKAMTGEKVLGTVDLDALRKDMRAMLDEAKRLGVELPVTALTLACYDKAASAGLGALDPVNETAWWSSPEKPKLEGR